MTALTPGDLLDHYRIESLVARNGMASIFRATDLDNGRTVAIKVPHPEMEADPQLFDRFKRRSARPASQRGFATPSTTSIRTAWRIAIRSPRTS
jgi:serine/threonine protein kinase